jgi:hypothetical protein
MAFSGGESQARHRALPIGWKPNAIPEREPQQILGLGSFAIGRCAQKLQCTAKLLGAYRQTRGFQGIFRRSA